MSTRFTPQGLVHEHSDSCSHSLDGRTEGVTGCIHCATEEAGSPGWVDGQWVHDNGIAIMEPCANVPRVRPADLPDRVIVGQNGAYWRESGDTLSMCPVSEDNDPVEAVAIYERSCDQIVRAIFNNYERRQPHRDPGDLTISIQDDMPYVTVHADTRGCIGQGRTLSEALTDALRTSEGKSDRQDDDDPIGGILAGLFWQHNAVLDTEDGPRIVGRP